MGHFLFLIFALCAEGNSFIKVVSGRGVSYEGLGMNFLCYPKDSCAERRMEDYRVGGGYFVDVPPNYSCSCDRTCSKLGTCCIDSAYRDVPRPAVMPTCRKVRHLEGFYMVDKCEDGGDYSPVWREWCEEDLEWREEMRMIAPVTSLATSVTYKNYYCLRCYETTNAFLYWNVKLSIFYGPIAEFEVGIPNTEVSYDRDTKTWQVEGADGRTFDADMEFEAPMDLRSLVVYCDADVISNCSDSWVDEKVRSLCSAYMGIVYGRGRYSTGVYRNVHCALCNFVSEENLQCESLSGSAGGKKGDTPSMHCKFMLNTNTTECKRSNETEVRFVKDNDRDINCACEEYVIKDKMCVPPEGRSDLNCTYTRD